MPYLVRELTVGNTYEYKNSEGTFVVKVLSGAYFLKLNAGYIEVEVVEILEDLSTYYTTEASPSLPYMHEIWLDDTTIIKPTCSLERLLYED